MIIILHGGKMDESVIIEAIIFSAGKPVGAEEIAQACGLTPDAVRAGLKKLVSGYDKRQTAIEIARVGSKYCMQLKPDVLPQAGALARVARRPAASDGCRTRAGCSPTMCLLTLYRQAASPTSSHRSSLSSRAVNMAQAR